MLFPTPAPVAQLRERDPPVVSCLLHLVDCVASGIEQSESEKQKKKQNNQDGDENGDGPEETTQTQPQKTPLPLTPSTIANTTPPQTAQQTPVTPSVVDPEPTSIMIVPSTSTNSQSRNETPAGSQYSSGGPSITATAAGAKTPGPFISTALSVVSDTSSLLTIVIPGSASFDAQGYTNTYSPGATFTLPNGDPSATSSGSSKTAASGAVRKLNAGAIAGGVLGVLVLLVIVFFAVFLVRRRRRRNMAPSAEFLDWSFQPTPSFAENQTPYPFGSPHATSSYNRSSISHTPTVGHGFTFPSNNA